jgi:hypothetical protein
MHVPDALWFTYLPVFRSVARLSRRTCNTLRILLTIPIGPPFQVPQHGDHRRASTPRNPGSTYDGPPVGEWTSARAEAS